MTQNTYKGLPSWTLENDTLQLTLLPGYAWKIASLISKKTSRKLLELLNEIFRTVIIHIPLAGLTKFSPP